LLRGLRQDEFAAQLRENFGLQWTRATVAAVETGRRQVRLDELPMVCAILQRRPVDLFRGEGPVVLADGVKGQLEDVQQLILGDFDKVKLVGLGWKPPRKRRPAPDWLIVRLAVGRVTIGEITTAARGEAEMKAARKLGVDAEVVATAALGLWKQTLTEHRDAIVAASAPADASPRTLQAMRGRVTRELVEELRERIEEARRGEC
jgi:hypothetical protein